MTTSLSIDEILLFVKRWSKIAVANIANERIRNAYLCPDSMDNSVKRLRNFCINETKW